jgi:hypothetical protein
VRARLTRDFIPVAANLDDLQHGPPSDVRTWFMSVAGKVNPRVNSGRSGQGFYIIGYDGTAYGHTNRRTSSEVRAFMANGLQAFRRQPPKSVHLNPEKREKPDPAETTVLRVFTRISPVPRGAASSNRAVGRDHLWIYSDEVRALAEGEVGSRLDVPESLRMRIAQFHLADNVRGEPDYYPPSQVERAEMGARVLDERNGLRRLRLYGEFAMVGRGQVAERGFRGTLIGEAVIDTKRERIVDWRMVGEGHAWGRGRYTPGEPPGKFPLLVAMVKIDDPVARAVPPAALSKLHAYAPAEFLAGYGLNNRGF